MSKNALSTILIFTGVVLLTSATYLTWQRHTPTRLAFNSTMASTTTTLTKDSIMPQALYIDSTKVALPVIAQTPTAGKWPATTKGISYLTNSALPGETGNSILYGHNWPNLLGSLHKVKPGELISIRMANGEVRHFRVVYIAEVTPDQTHILKNTSDVRLTLYTCSGFLDSKRLVVTAIREPGEII